MPVSQYNILRPKAFDKNAASAQQVTPTSVLPSAANPVGASNLPNGGSGASTVDPNSIPPEQVAALQAAAAQGDESAIDLLKMLGIGAAIAGTATGTTMLARAMANRGGKVPAAPLPNAEAASIIPPKGSTAVVPYSTKLRGEHLVSEPGILPPMRNITPRAAPKVTPELLRMLPKLIR